MSWDGRFKYEPMQPDKVKTILQECSGDVHKYIQELYELINYQKETINSQRVEIIGLRHKEAWKRYDK